MMTLATRPYFDLTEIGSDALRHWNVMVTFPCSWLEVGGQHSETFLPNMGSEDLGRLVFVLGMVFSNC